MGVSVTSGMVTTFIACVSLFTCDMLWFSLFGCFIAMVILSAYTTSMLFLMSMLAHFGTSKISPEITERDEVIDNELEMVPKLIVGNEPPLHHDGKLHQ